MMQTWLTPGLITEHLRMSRGGDSDIDELPRGEFEKLADPIEAEFYLGQSSNVN